MNEEKTLKRKWVKKAAAFFLVVMLVLTFFSNTIMNYSLPQVSVKQVEAGSIIKQVKGSGLAEALGKYEVMVNQTRGLERVLIQPGDTVNEGDILFQLEQQESQELKGALDTLDDLNLQYQKALISNTSKEYRQENRDIEKAKEALGEALDIRDNNIATKLQVDSAEAALEQRKEEVKELTKKISELEMEMGEYSGASDEALESLGYQIEDKVHQINNADTNSEEEPSADMSQLRRELRRLNDDYAAMQRKKKAYTRKSKELKRARDELSKANDSLEEAQSEYDRLSEKHQDWRSANEQVTQRQNTLDDLMFALEEKKKQDNITSSLDSLDFEKLKKDLAEQQIVVEELQADAVNGEVKAQLAGTVKVVNISAGGTTAPNSALAVIETTGQGYMLSFPVTKEQSKLVAVGDTAKVEGEEDVSATLKQIKNDPSNPGESKILVFLLEGELESGDLFSLALEEPPIQYDMIVPNSALHFDNNGHFVLALTSKRTPFGSRYMVKRVSVKVLDTDEQNTAVSGALMAWDYVITNSTELLEDGTQVRMKDSE